MLQIVTHAVSETDSYLHPPKYTFLLNKLTCTEMREAVDTATHQPEYTIEFPHAGDHGIQTCFQRRHLDMWGVQTWNPLSFIVARHHTHHQDEFVGLYAFKPSKSPTSQYLCELYDLTTHYSNAKITQDADFKYLTVIRTPKDSQGSEYLTLEDLVLRVPREQWHHGHPLQGLRHIIIELTRETIGSLPHTYNRAFDHELFSFADIPMDFADVCGIPPKLVQFVRSYMHEALFMAAVQPEPFGNCSSSEYTHMSVYQWLKLQLDVVITSQEQDQRCSRSAKMVSGFVAQVSHQLFVAISPPTRRVGLCGQMAMNAGHFGHIQALQEYQIRQLVETALFWHDPKHGLDHSMGAFVRWAQNMKEWRQSTSSWPAPASFSHLVLRHAWHP